MTIIKLWKCLILRVINGLHITATLVGFLPRALFAKRTKVSTIY